MLEKINELLKIKTTSYNQKNISVAFELCKSFYKINHLKEIVKNGFRSILFSNFDTLNFDVLSLCHLDVVDGNEKLFSMEREGNILKARGVFDMKAFIISSLKNLEEFNNSEIKIGVLITSDEEIGGKNCSEMWSKELKLQSKIILDCDDGYNINNIVKKRYGTAAVDLLDSKENNIKFFGKKIKDNFIYSELKNGNEINIYFDGKFDFTPFEKIRHKIISVEKPLNFSTNNKYLTLYREILEKNTGQKINFITSKNSTDARFFYDSSEIVIVNQSTGGNNHKDDEWLDYESLLIFSSVQREFLKKIATI